MQQEGNREIPDTSRPAEEAHLEQTLSVVRRNMENYGSQVKRMKEDIDEMLEHYHDNDAEVYTILNNTITLHDYMKRALLRNEKALKKPYFGRIVFHDEKRKQDESLYIGKGGISRDPVHQEVIDWRSPVANAYYENGLGKCSYAAPDGKEIAIDLKLKRTYEIEEGTLLDYFDSEIVANDDLLTKYLSRNKQAVLNEIVATIQKEQNEIIRKSPYHNIIVQGTAGSGKTTVAMHRISFILYNYAERFRPEDFYIVGSNRILLNYITGVLPDLDVHGVRQMTMEELFVRLLYEDWDEKKYQIRKISQDRKGSASPAVPASHHSPDCVKGSTAWFEDLKAYCDEVEWNTILRDSIYLNRRQFVEGLKDGKSGVYDLTEGEETHPGDLVLLMDGAAVERYIRQNPRVSLQSKINMLNERLFNKVKEEFWGKEISYTEAERKAILKAYRGRYGGKAWKGSIYDLYRDFLRRQIAKGHTVDLPDTRFDVYDLAALAYLYKRIKETEVISEAHHVVIDEAQDFGMMAYRVLHFCIQDCTYTIMGDVSQNIHFGYGLNDWEELRGLMLADKMASFGVLKRSYRNTVEISEFAARILQHGSFPIYPAEPIIRHGDPVQTRRAENDEELIRMAADQCREWQQKGFETIAVVCRNQEMAEQTARQLGKHIEVLENDLEKAQFGAGILVLPVEYTKGLEFDAVLILDPTRESYPADDGHARLLYVAATRALHELCVLSRGDLTGLIADPLPAPRTQSRETTVFTAKPLPTPREKTAKAGRPAAGIPTPARKIAIPSIPGQAARPSIPAAQAQRPAIPSDRSPRPGSASASEQRPAISAPGSSGSAVAPMQRPTISAPDSFGSAVTPAQRPMAAAPSPTEKSAPGSSPAAEGKHHPAFGDLPPTEKLRPAGHSKIDLAVRWITKQADGLYLQSRYGTLRLSPIGSAILRVTFARNGQQLPVDAHPLIAVRRIEKYWMYRDTGSLINLTTDELSICADKTTGALRYLTPDKKTLLAERNRECRQIEGESGYENTGRVRLFLDWAKTEHLYGLGDSFQNLLSLRTGATYISGTKDRLPFLLSDKGYGILIAADTPVICCDLPAYGSYFSVENSTCMDYYFIVGRGAETLFKACEYLYGNPISH